MKIKMTPKKIFSSLTIFCRHVLYFVLDQWKSVLFSAALAGIFEHLGLLKIFTKFSWLLVASLAAQDAPIDVSIKSHTPIVVTIGEDRFVNHYSEKRPLDRCVLRQDIAAILAKGTQRLAIDFDLSPLAHANGEDQTCQNSLNSLLDQAAKRIVILTPFPVKGELKKSKHEWMLARCANGVHFGDGTLDQSLGMVNEQIIGDDEMLQSRFAEQLHAGFNDHACKLVKDAQNAQDNPWLKAEDEKKEESEFETAPINFSAVQNQLAVIDIGSQDFKDAVDWEQNVVFFGGDWGRDDNYLTPLGRLAGVVIHGARLVSLEHPIASLPPAIGLMTDIGIALCFAWVVGQFWTGYVMATRFDMHIRELSQGHLRTAIGTVVIFAFIVIYLLLVLYFIFASEYLFLEKNIMLAPLLMAISILFDGFVSAPIEQIQKLLEENEEKKEVQKKSEIEHETLKEKGKLRQRFIRSGVLILSLCVLLILAINYNWIHFSSIAGNTFIFVIAGLYLCLVVGASHLIYEKARHWLASVRQGKQIFSWIHIVHALKNLLPFKFIPDVSPEQEYKKYNGLAVKIGYFFSWLRAVIFWGIILLAMNYMFFQ